jgi:hypothetical protein
MRGPSRGGGGGGDGGDGSSAAAMGTWRPRDGRETFGVGTGSRVRGGRRRISGGGVSRGGVPVLVVVLGDAEREIECECVRTGSRRKTRRGVGCCVGGEGAAVGGEGA